MKDLKEILYTNAKVNSCEHIIKTYPFLENTILEAINEALRIHDVIGRSEQLKPEPQICYKSNEPCKYNCSGLCKESY